MRMNLSILAALTVLAATSQANATTATANFNAHVKLVAACTTSATALEFGTLPGLIQGTETTTSTLTVTCTKGAAYTLALAAGSGAMTGQTTATDKVNYTATLATSAGSGTGSAQTYTINGALSAQATPSAQDYVEARSVTVTY